MSFCRGAFFAPEDRCNLMGQDASQKARSETGERLFQLQHQNAIHGDLKPDDPAGEV